MTTIPTPIDVRDDPASAGSGWRRRWKWLVRLECDQAVALAMLLRGWQMLAGFVTVLLVSTCLPAELQGYYFTFASLVGTQALFDLGLSTIAVNLVSHEWASFTRVRPDKTAHDGTRYRFMELGQRLVRWYAAAALAFALLVSVGGFAFFSARAAASAPWQLPWLTLVAITSCSLATMPLIAILEGCNQVVAVNRMRLVQGVLAAVAVWACLVLGGGLWALVAAAVVRSACELTLIRIRWRGDFAPLFERPLRGFIDWQREVWPLQWRLGVQAAAGYLVTGLLTPLLFLFHGSVIAGQLGLTWTVLLAFQQAALAWMHPRVPRLGMLAALRDYAELDRLCLRLTIRSAMTLTAFCVGLWSVVFFGQRWDVSIVFRFLDPLPMGLLGLMAVVNLVLACQGYHVRAFKREPFLVLSLVSELLTGAAAWWLGSEFGPTAAIAGMLAVAVIVVVPWQTAIWRQCRIEARRESEGRP